MIESISPIFADARTLRRALATRPTSFWVREGEAMALRLFQAAARQVPAYRLFLRHHRVNPQQVRTIEDFKAVPAIDKTNYLRRFSLPELSWDGKLTGLDVISVSSGSTGEPFFWPRCASHDAEATVNHELFLTDSFGIDRRSTLFVVSFAMGMWVAGTLTYTCARELATRYPMNVIAPGIQKDEVLRIIRGLGERYDQVVIAGYPPFVKDIIDAGPSAGISWKQHRVKFLFAAESFSEPWRAYLYRKVYAADPLRDSLNIYGTADALILAHETPFSILARRIAVKRKSLYRDLFRDLERAPTLAQYNPAWRFFEEVDGELVFSASSGIPLIRYRVGDSGGIISFETMLEVFTRHGVDLLREAQKHQISVWRLPFVYVFGRSDFTVFLYGVNIYPENIRDALASRKLERYTTGKFTMITQHTRTQDPYLEVNVELQQGSIRSNRSLRELISHVLVETLRKRNSEYHRLYEALGKRVEPRVVLYPYGHPTFFSAGTKQKWHLRA